MAEFYPMYLSFSLILKHLCFLDRLLYKEECRFIFWVSISLQWQCYFLIIFFPLIRTKEKNQVFKIFYRYLCVSKVVDRSHCETNLLLVDPNWKKLKCMHLVFYKEFKNFMIYRFENKWSVYLGKAARTPNNVEKMEQPRYTETGMMAGASAYE